MVFTVVVALVIIDCHVKILKPCHFERSEKSCIIYFTNIVKISPYGRNDILWIADKLTSFS